MRFGFWTGNGQSWEDTLEGCIHAERTGWDGIWYADHFMPNEENVDQPIHEAWSILAAIAASVPERHWAFGCGKYLSKSRFNSEDSGND